MNSIYMLFMGTMHRNIKTERLNVSVALEALGAYAKSIYKTLRKLKKYSVVATDIMKALLNLKSVDVVSGMRISKYGYDLGRTTLLSHMSNVCAICNGKIQSRK